jgi:hypothetical protein
VLERTVGVPELVALLVHALAAFGAPDLAVGSEIGNIRKAGIDTMRMDLRVQYAVGLHRTELQAVLTAAMSSAESGWARLTSPISATKFGVTALIVIVMRASSGRRIRPL